MSRLIFVPQYPSKMRYQEWWYINFQKEFRKYFNDVIVLGENYLNEKETSNYNPELFAPTFGSIEFENAQICDYMKLDIRDDDILFLSDISFPGFFCNVLYHKPIKNAFAFCHATAKNRFDYFDIKKYDIETNHSKLFKKIFVATEYHKNKLCEWDNIINLGALPYPPFAPFKGVEKSYDVVSLSRVCEQKINIEEENHLHYKPIRKTFDSWIDYYVFISKSKCVLITANEDTYGYQIIDAVLNNTVPIVPNRNCYSELLPKEYIYNDVTEMNRLILKCINYQLKVPQLKNKLLIENFYKNLIGHIKIWSN